MAAVSNTSPTQALDALIKKSGAQTTPLSDASASQDRFLKLLVAQLNNQDPMNPMDNAQMTTQMAQINTVSGIQQLNETVKSLSGQFASMQLLQGTTMIGHDVLKSGNSLRVNAGVAQGAMELPSNADKVSVQILSPGGQVLDTLNLGALSAGRHHFQWDASGYNGGGTLSFKVSAMQGSQAMSSTPLARDGIAAVSSSATGMSFQLKSGATLAYEDIKAVL